MDNEKLLKITKILTELQENAIKTDKLIKERMKEVMKILNIKS